MSTRDTVIVAAQRLLALDPTASMAQIATAAGVGRATVHRHFASREDLLREIGERSLDRWEESMAAVDLAGAVDSGDAQRIRATLEGLVHRFVADLDDFGIALTDPTVTTEPQLKARCDALFVHEVTLYAAAQAAGILRADVPAVWLGHAHYGLLVAVRDALVAGDVARRDAEGLVLGTFLDGGAAR